MLEKPFIFKVNENGGGPTLLLQVFSERGWVEYKDEGPLKDKWNLWWRTNCLPLHYYKTLNTWQFINRIPEAASICRKDHLARSLKTMRGLFGAIYEFSPTTFILPIDYTKLVNMCSHVSGSDERVWICKPVGRSQGKGITVFRVPKRRQCCLKENGSNWDGSCKTFSQKATELLYDSTSCVVQEYIKNPLLIGGYKFDLRLYVCVPCFHPLTVYVYREGLARFGTNKFSLTELDNRCAHLTNSSINRNAPGYLQLKDKVGAGCKWSLKQLRFYLQQNGLDDWLMWQQISTIIVLTVASQLSGVPTSTNCFEFYGFDILIDSSLKPWLIEVNNSPALCSDCDLDPAIKKPLLHDLLDLLGLPMCNTGISLVSDWGDFSFPKDRPPTSFTDTARKAVTVIKMASHWKKQIHGSSNLKGKKPASKEYRVRRTTEKNSQPCETEKKCARERRCRGRGERPDHSWANGQDWARPPEGCGEWVRVYPCVCRGGGPTTGRESRDVVLAVARASRLARTVFTKLRDGSDLHRDTAFGHHSPDSVWHPNR